MKKSSNFWKIFIGVVLVVIGVAIAGNSQNIFEMIAGAILVGGGIATLLKD